MYNTIKYIKDKIKLTPKIGLILGSGLTGISKLIKISYSLNYTDIPGMKTPSVHGHGGTFIFGTIAGIPIVCASGRFHYYEGLGMDKVIMPVKIFYELGVKTIIITNSSGCLKKQWDLGSFMLIKSTMDFTFKENINDPLSVDISDHKFDKMTKLILHHAKKNNIKIQQGCYVWTHGPTYESHAEVEKIISLNGGAVGMSTLPEIKASLNFGMSVLAIACLTNYAAGIKNRPLTHEEVVSMAGESEEKLSCLVQLIIKYCIIQ